MFRICVIGNRPTDTTHRIFSAVVLLRQPSFPEGSLFEMNAVAMCPLSAVVS
uniref:Uncharacterized protein n=1 Tax=Anguilla anguilla TaxID=7936 RepID=A0A0E9V9G1_ANGAN